jgi:hypothetical protein
MEKYISNVIKSTNDDGTPRFAIEWTYSDEQVFEETFDTEELLTEGVTKWTKENPTLVKIGNN